jgi:hypothetical protein
MSSEKGYFKRQFHMLASLGLFYAILIALFAIPLVGTLVVILIKGALDLRYFIIAGGFFGVAILGFFIIRALKRLWYRIQRDGFKAGEIARRHQLTGKPVEISILGGMFKFTVGQPGSAGNPALSHDRPFLLPDGTDRDPATDIVIQLQELSELKRAGTIDADEFRLLKAVLIETSASAARGSKQDRSAGHTE